MIQKVRKAVFPAAGLGTRFLPATKAQPKEMLPLVDKPIIQYGVEEALASGIDNIILVTSRGKSAIEDHFDHSFELEHLLESRGDIEMLRRVRQIGDMVQIAYVRQKLSAPPTERGIDRKDWDALAATYAQRTEPPLWVGDGKFTGTGPFYGGARFQIGPMALVTDEASGVSAVRSPSAT